MSKPLPFSKGVVSLTCACQEVVVISDLHLADGKNKTGNFSGTENFFSDQSFVRFLDHLTVTLPGTSLLAINGDFIDFLRITSLPTTDQDFSEWFALLQSLQAAGAPDSIPKLQASISSREKEYGLKTHEFKSIWKLEMCSRGHKEAFSALSKWIANGNCILIVKGNHDLEWHWPKVRQHFTNLLNASHDQVCFADDKIIINDLVYLEHGHLFENITFASGGDTINNGTELNLSFGAFFNRYLLNKIELDYPYLDNIRPSTNILPILIRERFPLAIKLLFHYIPFVFKIIPKKQIWHAIKYAATFILMVVIPFALVAFVIFDDLQSKGLNVSSFLQRGDKTSLFASLLKNLLLLVISYVFGRILVFVKLAPPGSLVHQAEIVKRAHPKLKVITFGHTHTAEQTRVGDATYFNTGTWMPVFELDAADVQLGQSYSFLHVTFDKPGNVITEPLQRWNDDAGRPEPLVLIQQ